MAGISLLRDSVHAQAVPNSSGTERPTLTAPPGACDCHHHIYDVKFPPVRQGAGFQPNGRVEEYRLLQRRLGTTRDVTVTPLPYAGDNRVTLDAIKTLAPNARGVALLRSDVTDAELRQLTDAGVRGLRFSLGRNTSFDGSNPVADIEPLTKRVANFGWHTQIFMRGDQIVQAQDVLNRIPTPVVFDHLGVLGVEGVKHPAFTVMRRLVDGGRAWVKLSGAYITPTGTTTDYTPATAVAKAFVAAAPERLVWGSDWPHPDADISSKPDDAKLLDLLMVWAPEAGTRHRILVENPEVLYGFPRTSPLWDSPIS